MNHFEMKKLDRQMHIYRLSLSLSPFCVCVCYIYVCANICLINFRLHHWNRLFIQRVCNPFSHHGSLHTNIGDIFFRCQSKCGWTSACPSLSPAILSLLLSLYRCVLVQNYDKGILLGLKIGHPLCRYQCDVATDYILPPCAHSLYTIILYI